MYSFVYYFSLPEDFLETSCFITFLLKIRRKLLLTPKEKKSCNLLSSRSIISVWKREVDNLVPKKSRAGIHRLNCRWTYLGVTLLRWEDLSSVFWNNSRTKVLNLLPMAFKKGQLIILGSVKEKGDWILAYYTWAWLFWILKIIIN